MAEKVNPIPEGFNTVTPYLAITGAARAIEYYKRAFGAELISRMDKPDGKIMHASMKIGDSIIMLADECDPHSGHQENCYCSPASLKGTSVNLYLYVKDVDDVFDRAIKAGGRNVMDVCDMFWGDRMGMLKDPFGHFWTVASRKEIVSKDEMQKRAAEFLKECAATSAK